jgi:hypothetical protein
MLNFSKRFFSFVFFCFVSDRFIYLFIFIFIIIFYRFFFCNIVNVKSFIVLFLVLDQFFLQFKIVKFSKCFCQLWRICFLPIVIFKVLGFLVVKKFSSAIFESWDSGFFSAEFYYHRLSFFITSHINFICSDSSFAPILLQETTGFQCRTIGSIGCSMHKQLHTIAN